MPSSTMAIECLARPIHRSSIVTHLRRSGHLACTFQRTLRIPLVEERGDMRSFSRLTSLQPWEDNPARLRWSLMSLVSIPRPHPSHDKAIPFGRHGRKDKRSLFSVLLLSGDLDLQAHFKHALQEATVTVAKDPGSLPRSEIKRTYDGVILETKGSVLEALLKLERSIDPSRTFVLAGSRPVLKHASHVVRAVANGNGYFPRTTGREFSLEDYVESKLTDFVKGMKHTSARNLYAMLIEAVERPLITLVLKETNGNQTQAAHFLGMNRNTLRTKIAEFRISVKREKSLAK